MRVGMPGDLAEGCGGGVHDLNHFFIAIFGAVVDDDGRGVTAFYWVVWSAGSLFCKRRRVIRTVRDRAWLPCLDDMWAAVRFLQKMLGAGLPRWACL